jgi:hypothetical protein
MMGAFDKLLDVIQHRGKKRQLQRRPSFHFTGQLIHRGGQAPQVVMVFADDAQCVHGLFL